MSKIEIKNKKARHLYEFIEHYTAGIQLYGTEIKSIRTGKASLSEGYCRFIGDELFVYMHISEYTFGTCNNHDPKRERKLLLTRRELNKLKKKFTTKGLSIIPLRLYIGETGWAKLDIVLAKGKKAFDKREDLKKRDTKRDIDRMLKT